jgi:hypothetical protein
VASEAFGLVHTQRRAEGALRSRSYRGENKRGACGSGAAQLHYRIDRSAAPPIVIRSDYFFIFSSSMHFFCASPLKVLHFSGTCPKTAGEPSAKRASKRKTSDFFMCISFGLT